MSARPWLSLGAGLGFLAVAAGAFGTHGLKDTLSPERLANWDTASDYALAHALALVAAGLLAAHRPSRAAGVAGTTFALGVLLFSGSLWALALTDVRALGMITPFGGLAFLVGWAALAVAGSKAPVAAQLAAPSKAPVAAQLAAPSKAPVAAQLAAPSKAPVAAQLVAPSKAPAKPEDPSVPTFGRTKHTARKEPKT